MIIEMKQIATGFLARYELIELSGHGGKIPFGMVATVPKGQNGRMLVVNMQNHIYRIAPMDAGEYSFGVDAVGETIGRFYALSGPQTEVRGPRQHSYSTKHAIEWRGNSYFIREVPVFGDGLYYQIEDCEKKTIAIIERAIKVYDEKDCYVVCVERDGDVAMSIMAMVYIDMISVDISRDNTIPCYTLELPAIADDIGAKATLDAKFLSRFTSAG